MATTLEIHPIYRQRLGPCGSLAIDSREGASSVAQWHFAEDAELTPPRYRVENWAIHRMTRDATVADLRLRAERLAQPPSTIARCAGVVGPGGPCAARPRRPDSGPPGPSRNHSCRSVLGSVHDAEAVECRVRSRQFGDHDGVRSRAQCRAAEYRHVRVPLAVGGHGVDRLLPPASLTEQIGGQLAAGFTLTHLDEAPHHADATARYLPGYFASRAIRP